MRPLTRPPARPRSPTPSRRASASFRRCSTTTAAPRAPTPPPKLQATHAPCARVDAARRPRAGPAPRGLRERVTCGAAPALAGREEFRDAATYCVAT
eukprot:2423129-Prymnesium_polylepis.1